MPRQLARATKAVTAAVQKTVRISDRLSCQQVPPTRVVPDLAEDVRRGLLTPPRALPPKYFYDGRGSRLFDRICDTPEYYPTRTEDALLERYAPFVVEQVRPEHIVELGSGASRKTRHLLSACAASGRSALYWPFDVCEPMLLDAGRALTDEYPWLEVRALVGDYLAGLAYLPPVGGGRLWVFLGGTLGNFEHDQAVRFLSELAGCMSPADWLLLGVDRVKNPAVLHAAYNDAAGLTAEFNLNVLRVLNRELDADFDLERFAHRAIYNTDAEQIEMYLVARGTQQVRIGGLKETVYLQDGEAILTEISRKFTLDSLQALLGEAGLNMVHHAEPDNGYFSLVLARPQHD